MQTTKPYSEDLRTRAVVLTVLIINLRLTLYSASLALHFTPAPEWTDKPS
jgi:predicted branched-subunit amino acid permease